jgi:N-acetylmuramoyl-L-alanine amidase
MLDGKMMVQLASRHVGERYVFGTLVPMSNAAWKGPWDCAEFASWCHFQATGQLFGCRPRSGNPDSVDAYTGFWGDDATTSQSTIPVEVAAATPGAFLLRLPRPGATGHIVISAGDGSTVEAMDRKHGVVRSVLAHRRWDFGVLAPGLEVSSGKAAPVAEPGLIVRETKPPATGVRVKTIQRALKALGLSPGLIDGAYGPQTAAAVRAFQVDKGLVPDGETGVTTARALKIDWPE